MTTFRPLTISNLRLTTCEIVLIRCEDQMLYGKGFTLWVCVVSYGLSIIMFMTTVDEKWKHYRDFNMCQCVHMPAGKADSVWSQLLCWWISWLLVNYLKGISTKFSHRAIVLWFIACITCDLSGNMFVFIWIWKLSHRLRWPWEIMGCQKRCRRI